MLKVFGFCNNFTKAQTFPFCIIKNRREYINKKIKKLFKKVLTNKPIGAIMNTEIKKGTEKNDDYLL